MILTRDRQVVQLCGCPALLIQSDQFRTQVRQVFRKYKLKRALFTRCSLCNTPLQTIAKSQVKRRVPPDAYAAYDRFWRCPRCRKIYWIGSHSALFRKDLRKR